MTRIGVVIIGRNEGERLVRCLESVLPTGAPTAYVDSGSTDNSVQVARGKGVLVVELDPARPFSAARARNEGLESLLRVHSDLRYVHFIDGDCELAPGWLDAASAELDRDPRVAAVCGRLRERQRQQSIYNRLCDIEWAGEMGRISSCGGVATYRVESFLAQGGFHADIVAGEEPELCLRLRRAGHDIIRIATEMGTHDAAMTSWRHWWKRSVRSGFAYAEGAARHGRSPDRYCVSDCRSIWLWGAAIPLAAGAGAWPTGGWSLLLLAVYPLQAWRIHRRMRRRGYGWGDAALYACACVAGKFPALQGQVRYVLRRVRGGPVRVIEHRPTAVSR